MEQYYFLHIAKNAGTSFRNVLYTKFPSSVRNQYGGLHKLASCLKEDPRELDKYRFVVGHFGFSAVSHFSHPPRILTMLRDPVARTLSTFKHIKVRNPKEAARTRRPHWLLEEFDGENATIEEFLQYPPARRLVTNFQTRNIALEYDLTADYRDAKGNPLGYFQGRLMAHISDSMSDEALLELAKARLREMWFVGLVERFGESLSVLSHLSKWKIAKIAPDLNKTSQSLLPVTGLSEKTMAEIRKITALDAQLYDYAESLLDEQLRAMDKQ